MLIFGLFHRPNPPLTPQPQTQETLWLRILGKETTQQQAINEAIALPIEDPRRLRALKLLATWKINIEAGAELDEEGRELVMTLSQAYLEWERETERRGMQQGQRLVVENLLRVRFGELDDQLVAIIPSLLELPTEEYTRLLLQLSREELLARFQSPTT